MIHELKILPEHFTPVLDELKTAELRKSDRPFSVGDNPLRNVARLRYCKRKSVQNIGSSLIYYCAISPKEARNRMEWAMDILEGEMFYAIKREMEKEIPKIAA